MSAYSLASSSSPARVIWLSSLDTKASDVAVNPNDWQLIHHNLPYQASKRELDLVVAYLERKNIEAALVTGDKTGNTTSGIRHVLAQPGVVSTNIQSTMIGFWLLQLMQLTFICVRLFWFVLKFFY